MKKVFIPVLLLAMLSIAMSPNQFFKTQLKVTVLDDLGNIQTGATVSLFVSEKDFKEEKNAILSDADGTDAKGVIWFKTLEAKEYWVLATKGEKNNWGNGIKTDPLKEKKVNKINIIID